MWLKETADSAVPADTCSILHDTSEYSLVRPAAFPVNIQY